MPEGGRLTLKTESVTLDTRYCEIHPAAIPGAYVVFSIADTGCGMTAEVKERLFEPFFSTKDVGQGTGLGLAAVYGCVQQHNGLINVYSEVGHGTTIRIYMPLAESGRRRRNGRRLAAAGGHETILVAEDEPWCGAWLFDC